MTIEEELCAAIDSRSVIVITSAKDPEGATREVEPHIVYEASTRNILVDFYQLAGYSERGTLEWKRLKVADIQKVERLDKTFKIRWAEDYNPDNRDRYRRVICKVQEDQNSDKR